MTEQHNIPGLHESGMFFEYYVFEPMSNFEEGDLFQILQFFDIKFESEESIPKSTREHFNGVDFEPKEGITVDQFADILTAMGIKCETPEAYTRLPKGLQEQFNDDMVFEPYDDFSLADLVMFLRTLAHLRLTTQQFNILPRKMQRQFIVFTRDGKHWRYGDRRPA